MNRVIDWFDLLFCPYNIANVFSLQAFIDPSANATGTW